MLFVILLALFATLASFDAARSQIIAIEDDPVFDKRFTYQAEKDSTIRGAVVTVNGDTTPYIYELCDDTSRFSDGVFSVTFSMDISASMGESAKSYPWIPGFPPPQGGTTKLEIEKYIVKQIVHWAQVSQFGVVGGNTMNRIIVDLTFDKTGIDQTIDNIWLFGGTSISNMIFDPVGGALSMAKRAIERRFVVFITDGEDHELSQQEIRAAIDECVANGITFHVLLIDREVIPFSAQQSLEAIARGTGGVFHRNIDTLSKVPFVLDSIVNTVTTYPCRLKFVTMDSCDESYHVVITDGRGRTLVDTTMANFDYAKNTAPKWETKSTPSLGIFTCEDTIIETTVKNVSSCGKTITVDGTTLRPGETFSKKRTVGPYGAPKKFSLFDTVVIDGKKNTFETKVDVAIEADSAIEALDVPDSLVFIVEACDTASPSFTLRKLPCLDSMEVRIHGEWVKYSDSLVVEVKRPDWPETMRRDTLEIGTRLGKTFYVPVTVRSYVDTGKLLSGMTWETTNDSGSVCDTLRPRLTIKSDYCVPVEATIDGRPYLLSGTITIDFEVPAPTLGRHRFFCRRDRKERGPHEDPSRVRGHGRVRSAGRPRHDSYELRGLRRRHGRGRPPERELQRPRDGGGRETDCARQRRLCDVNDPSVVFERDATDGDRVEVRRRHHDTMEDALRRRAILAGARRTRVFSPGLV